MIQDNTVWPNSWSHSFIPAMLGLPRKLASLGIVAEAAVP